MTNEHWVDRLSDYLDGDLGARERAQCEAHLEACPACAETLDELRVVVTEAATLPDSLPPRDLWPEIEGRLEPRAGPAEPGTDAIGPRRVLPFRTRRVSLTIPQLVAAGIALVLISASSVWLVLPRPAAGPGTVAMAPAGAAIPAAMTDGYDSAVRELQAEFEQRRASLDPETVRVVTENLAIIDTAIEEARAALVEDPSSGFLQTHLASAIRQKIELLSRVATLETTEI